jgi:hypothetical protein
VLSDAEPFVEILNSFVGRAPVGADTPPTTPLSESDGEEEIGERKDGDRERTIPASVRNDDPAGKSYLNALSTGAYPLSLAQPTECATQIRTKDGQTAPVDHGFSRANHIRQLDGVGSEVRVSQSAIATDDDLDEITLQSRISNEAMPRSQAAPLSAQEHSQSSVEATMKSRVTVKALETHLAAVATTLSTQQAKESRDGGSNGDSPIVRPFHEGALANSMRSAIKILTIELSPASLGQVTAKMRLLGSNITLELSVHTPEARRLLAQSEDALIEAIRSAGSKIESCEIRISSAQAASDTVLPSTQKPEPLLALENHSSAGDATMDPRGHRDGQRSQQDQESPKEKNLRAFVDPQIPSVGASITGIYI